MDCPNFPEFLAFATSCYSVLNVADLAHQQYKHYRMESLTTDSNALGEFCQTLTGLTYSQEQLDLFVASGPINRHRKQADSKNPWIIYPAWPNWKRKIVSMMIPETVLASFENVGYELGMLRDGGCKTEFASPAAPCLADSLGAMDKNHPLLAMLNEETAAKPRTRGWRHRVSKWTASRTRMVVSQLFFRGLRGKGEQPQFAKNQDLQT